MSTDIKYRDILPKPGSAGPLYGPTPRPRRRRRTCSQQLPVVESPLHPEAPRSPKRLTPFVTRHTLPKGTVEVAPKAFEEMKRYYFPTQEYLSYDQLASVLDPSPNSAPSLWRRVFDRQAELAVFYQLDYAADVPRVSKCIRIRKERNSSLQYVLVPTVYLHGQELSNTYVSAILGSEVLRNFEDVTRLLESLETAGLGEDENNEDASQVDNQLPAETLSSIDVNKLHSMFATSSTEPSSLFALQSQFTATPIRMPSTAPRPSISFVPIINNPVYVAQRRKRPRPEVTRVSRVTTSTSEASFSSDIEEGDVESAVEQELVLEDDEKSGQKEASISEDEGSSTSAESDKPRKRSSGSSTAKKLQSRAEKLNSGKASSTARRKTVSGTKMDSGLVVGRMFKTHTNLGNLKNPNGPVPPEFIELHNETAPWYFLVPGVGKLVLHPQYPKVFVEEQSLLTLQQQTRTCLMYKWFLFIQLLGGEQGLYRLSSLWTIGKYGQLKGLLGSDVIYALDQHCIDAQKAGVIPLFPATDGKRDTTGNFLAIRLSSWRKDCEKELKAVGAWPKEPLVYPPPPDPEDQRDTILAV